MLPVSTGSKLAVVIKLSVILLIAHVTYGCASSSGDVSSKRQGVRTSSAQAANLKCNAGEILVCKSREAHRVSDGRYGRKNKRNQKCEKKRSTVE